MNNNDKILLEEILINLNRASRKNINNNEMLNVIGMLKKLLNKKKYKISLCSGRRCHNIKSNSSNKRIYKIKKRKKV